MLKNESHRLSKSSIVFVLLVFFCLFAFRRMKFWGTPVVNGIGLNNLIIIVPIVILGLIVGRNCLIRIENRKLFYVILLFFFFCCFSIMVSQDLYQFFYALCLLFVPMLVLLGIQELQILDFDRIIGWFCFFGFVYSVLTIVASLNFGGLLSFLGYSVNNQQFYGQYRASLMIGSGITVSYYLNITLPLIFYKLFSDTSHKVFYVSALMLNVIATLIENSRLSCITMGLLLIYVIIFMQKFVAHAFRKKVLLIVGLIICIYFAMKYIDISHVLMGFSDASTGMRFEVFKTASYLFEKSPIVGTGLGRYFLRAWSTQAYVNIDGIRTLINTHNTQILLLAETGIIGFCFFYYILLCITRTISKIVDSKIRHTGIMIVIAYLLGSVGGTQLIDEISFSLIVWIYLGLYYKYSYYEDANENIG